MIELPCKYQLGEKLAVDESDLQGTVTAIKFCLSGGTLYEVSYLHAGGNYEIWIEEERLWPVVP